MDAEDESQMKRIKDMRFIALIAELEGRNLDKSGV